MVTRQPRGLRGLEVRELEGKQRFEALHDHFDFVDEDTEPMPLDADKIDLRPIAPEIESPEQAARRVRRA